ncbi:MAG: hypothetical protein AB7S56_04485 [Halothiobacillaceae bacterium]
MKPHAHDRWTPNPRYLARAASVMDARRIGTPSVWGYVDGSTRCQAQNQRQAQH